MNHPVLFSRIDNFGLITVNNPPVNAVNQQVADRIVDFLRIAEQDSKVKAVILSALGRTFIAGADINEFRTGGSGWKKAGNSLQPLLHSIENCRKPVICAIYGSALGGGLEIAMACHYRVAAASAQVGQPEVNLGLIPGGGGTQRLPRLAGVAKAAAMCSDGNSISAEEACQSGILDQLVQGELIPGALKFAREVVAQRRPLRKTRFLTGKLGDPVTNAGILEAAREKARRRHRGQMAPMKAIDAVESATKLSFEEGCRRESELFHDCLASDQSKALMHLFFAKRELSEMLDLDLGPLVEVREAAVVGAGSMGAGIAMAYANAGIPVLLKDVSEAVLEKSLARIRGTYERALDRGHLNRKAVELSLELIKPVSTYEGFRGADLIQEAVVEDLQLKKRIFSEISGVCKPGAILASNTSMLDIDEIATAASDPSVVVGHHFFAPAPRMPLLEIVRGRSTADRVIASSLALARRLQKIGVVVGNCPGFAGNRMYYPYQREAQFLVEEGADVQAVDAALYEFGMAMGPFAARDLTGLDVGWRTQNEYEALGSPDVRRPLVLDRLYTMGRFGQKTGAGWYRYAPGAPEPLPDPEVKRIIEECSDQAGIQRRSVSSAEILERTLYALVNEGARILEKGIVQRAATLDIIFVEGYGFPAYRGGPMWFADRVGLKSLYSRLREFGDRYGSRWSPAPLLRQLAEEGKSFADYDKVLI